MQFTEASGFHHVWDGVGSLWPVTASPRCGGDRRRRNFVLPCLKLEMAGVTQCSVVMCVPVHVMWRPVEAAAAAPPWNIRSSFPLSEQQTPPFLLFQVSFLLQPLSWRFISWMHKKLFVRSKERTTQDLNQLSGTHFSQEAVSRRAG